MHLEKRVGYSNKKNREKGGNGGAPEVLRSVSLSFSDTFET